MQATIEETREVQRADTADLATALKDAQDALARLRTVQARHRAGMPLAAIQAMAWVLSDENILEVHLRLLARHLSAEATG